MTLRSTLGYKPRKPKQRSSDEQRHQEHFRMVAFHRAEGRSQLTGATSYPMDVHHVVKAQKLRHVAPELLWDPDGAILLTREEHDRHHNGGCVISYEQLPRYIHRWAEHHDLTMFLERYHPRREAEQKKEDEISATEHPPSDYGQVA